MSFLPCGIGTACSETIKHSRGHASLQGECPKNVKESWWSVFKIMRTGLKKWLQMLWDDSLVPIPHNSVRHLFNRKAGLDLSYKTLHIWRVFTETEEVLGTYSGQVCVEMLDGCSVMATRLWASWEQLEEKASELAESSGLSNMWNCDESLTGLSMTKSKRWSSGLTTASAHL